MKHLRMTILMIGVMRAHMCSAFLHQLPKQVVGAFKTKSTTTRYTSLNMSTRKMTDAYARVYLGDTKMSIEHISCTTETPLDLVKKVKKRKEYDTTRLLCPYSESLLHCEASQMNVYPPGTPVPPPPGVEPLPKDEPLTQETDVDNPFIIVAPEVTDDNRLLESSICQKDKITTTPDLIKAYTKATNDLMKASREKRNLKKQFRDFILNCNRGKDGPSYSDDYMSKLNEKEIEYIPEEWLDDDDIIGKLYCWYEGKYEWAPLKLQANAKFYKMCIKVTWISPKMNWRDNVPDLAKHNPEIVMIALGNDMVALNAREVACIQKWDDIPKKMQMIPQVAWRAKFRGLVEMKDLEYLMYPEALKNGLESGDAKWHDVPESFQKDIDFVKSLTKFTVSTAKHILEDHPELGGEASFWYAIQQYYDIYEKYVTSWWLGGIDHQLLVDLLRTYGTQGDLLSDTDFWLKFLGLSTSKMYTVEKVPILQVADRSIWQNKEFVSRILGDFKIVSGVPRDIQVENVDLIKQAIEKTKHWSYRDYDDYVPIATNIAPELWQDRSVLQAWFKDASNPFIDDVHDFLSTDKEVFLWIAEHCDSTEQFEKAGSTLLQDRSFVKKALTLNDGTIFRDFFQKGDWEDDTEYELYFFAYGDQYYRMRYVMKEFRRRKQATKDEVLAHIEELEKDVIIKLGVDSVNNARSDNVDAATTDEHEMLCRALEGLQAAGKFIKASEE